MAQPFDTLFWIAVAVLAARVLYELVWAVRRLQRLAIWLRQTLGKAGQHWGYRQPQPEGSLLFSQAPNGAKAYSLGREPQVADTAPDRRGVPGARASGFTPPPLSGLSRTDLLEGEKLPANGVSAGVSQFTGDAEVAHPLPKQVLEVWLAHAGGVLRPILNALLPPAPQPIIDLDNIPAALRASPPAGVTRELAAEARTSPGQTPPPVPVRSSTSKTHLIDTLSGDEMERILGPTARR
jgi:hypothetical protein